MSNRATRNGKALSFLVVWTLAFGAMVAALLAFAPAVRAAPCDQVGGVITGDWTITTPQVCTGILYTVDGTINVDAGGSLTLVDGGLSFSKDADHAGYSLNVNAGGELFLDNSIVTTQKDAISPYVKLALTVSGANSRFTMTNGAVLKFPGWFNATGATINITDSTVTGFPDGELSDLGIDMDDNNDAPQIAWASTTASVYGSRIERLYEYVSGGNGTGTGVVRLTAGSNLFAYDSYLGVDYSDLADRHNELRVDATSNAYLYNVTIDRSQDPASKSDWQSAYVPTAAGGSVFLLRWLHATVRDATGFPVSGATITSTLSPSATAAQYPDNGFAATPTSRTLWYLGRAASGAGAWDMTDANGQAVIPLYSDQVTVASLPNAESFGNYEEVATFSTSSISGGAFFPPYPSIAAEDNNVDLTLAFTDLTVRTGPDLEFRQSEYTATLAVIQNQAFTAYARIYNSGQTEAVDVSVAAYLDGNRAAEFARVNGLSVLTFLNQSLSVAGIPVTGPHTLMLVADPDNTINEGGVAQENNNFVNITLDVMPPPQGFVAILSPSAGQTVEPGSALSVTGFVRDENLNGIVGAALTIELRSGSTLVATNQTVSGDAGFFIGTISVPSNSQDGSYRIEVVPASSLILADSRSIAVQRGGSFLFAPVPILGFPYWMFLTILGAALAIAIGVTTYWKVYGLGKMVECGECGAFIPEDAASCPKCGIEFEKDMAKCSNCQTWIPVDVKRCPECGVEFATGQLEIADYQEKMRLQYDEVVQKFKVEASRQLGRALSDGEFQEWWRKQPTFVTFEDWLREEEEMRKMGSKPCPVCGTLNSVTATVCHKCGSLMKDARPPMGGGGAPVIPASVPRRPSSGAPSPPEDLTDSAMSPYGARGGSVGTEAIPHRVIRKPIVPAGTIVQKKIIRKPVDGQGGEGSEGKAGGEDTSKDEI